MAMREAEAEEFVCKICMETLDQDEISPVFPLSSCEHVFHQECLAEYLNAKIDAQEFPMICPDGDCVHEGNIADVDVKEIITDLRYEKFTKFALNQAVDVQKDMSWCPTADC